MAVEPADCCLSTASSDVGLGGEEHTVNRIDRLLGLILLLQSRRVLTAEEVAAHFELSVRTIYRDLAALSEIGVPIAAEAGVGYSLLPGYHLPPLMFSQDEASALLIGGEMVKRFTDDSASISADSALLKIRAVLPRAQRDQVERLLEHLVVIGTPQRMGSPDRKVLLPVQQAIVRRRVLRCWPTNVRIGEHNAHGLWAARLFLFIYTSRTSTPSSNARWPRVPSWINQLLTSSMVIEAGQSQILMGTSGALPRIQKTCLWKRRCVVRPRLSPNHEQWRLFTIT